MKSQNSTTTTLPRCWAILSMATFIHGRPLGNSGARMSASGGGRTARQASIRASGHQDTGRDVMDFFSRVEQARERYNVLEHPFYTRWSAGELTLEELAAYAGQYRHAVVALAEASQGAARAAGPELRHDLEAHAA